MRAVGRSLLLVVCAMASLFGDGEQKPARQPNDVERAIEEFKIETANLGLRADGPRKVAASVNPLRDWHGRLSKISAMIRWTRFRTRSGRAEAIRRCCAATSSDST